jgi:DNA-binding beta-propeller fold protein YncE
MMRILVAAAALAFSTSALAQKLYVSDQQGGVIVLAGSTFARIGQIDVGGKGPRGIAVTHDGKFLLTANQATGDLSVIDRANGKLLARISIGPDTEMVRVLGHTAYVTFEPPTDKGGFAHVAIVDLDQLRVTAGIQSGRETEGVEFSLDGKYMLVANEGDDTISVYSLPGGSLVKLVRTDIYGTRPRGIKRLPDGSGYLVSLELSDRLVLSVQRGLVSAWAYPGQGAPSLRRPGTATRPGRPSVEPCSRAG